MYNVPNTMRTCWRPAYSTAPSSRHIPTYVVLIHINIYYDIIYTIYQVHGGRAGGRRISRPHHHAQGESLCRPRSLSFSLFFSLALAFALSFSLARAPYPELTNDPSPSTPPSVPPSLPHLCPPSPSFPHKPFSLSFSALC
jgi:hypothetical protein